MAKSLERTIRDLYRDKQEKQIDEQVQLDEVEIRKADYLAHKDGRMSIQDLMKKYNASQGAVQGEINLMRDHERNNRKVFDRMEEVEIDEGMMKNMAIDLKDMPADEFQRKYNMSKADAMKKFGAPEETELDEGMKYTHVAVDKKGLVIGFASNEKDAKDMARRNDGKVVKLKKPMSDKKGDMMVNRPFKEEVELDEAKDPSMDQVMAVMAPTKNAKEGVAAIMKSFKVDEKKAMKLLDAAIKHVLGESIDEETLDELSIMTLNRYYKKALQAIHKSRKSHDASIMRGMDPSKDKATISKRARGVNLAKSRALKKLRGEEVEIQEDGHEDIASAKNKVKIAMSALQKMQGELNKLGDDADLPSWWMGKVAVAVDKIDGMADYLDTQVEEKVLTPAEKKKREEIAQAIQRDNPDMPMDKKMAIATATAKKVAEEVQTEPATNQSLFHNYIQKLVKGEV